MADVADSVYYWRGSPSAWGAMAYCWCCLRARSSSSFFWSSKASRSRIYAMTLMAWLIENVLFRTKPVIASRMSLIFDISISIGMYS